MSANILPDSRLREKKGTVLVDWPLREADGTMTTVRLELEPIFCLSCGKSAGFVPSETVSFCSWLCEECSRKWGADASLHTHSDADFWAAVAAEMMARWGRVLTQEELEVMAARGSLGRNLELLERESPYRT